MPRNAQKPKAMADCPDRRVNRRQLDPAAKVQADDIREADAADNPDHAAEPGEGHGFDQELQKDVPSPRTDRLADADLARSFGARNEHDVHDADAADDQRDA